MFKQTKAGENLLQVVLPNGEVAVMVWVSLFKRLGKCVLSVSLFFCIGFIVDTRIFYWDILCDGVFSTYIVSSIGIGIL